MLQPQNFAMNILDAIRHYGLALKQKTTTEWTALCPRCGGKDRFILWPNHTTGTGGRFYCRQCGISGDTIDFLRKFQGLNFQDAWEKAGKTKGSLAGRESQYNRHNQAISSPARQKQSYLPPEKWIKVAGTFLANCQTDKALYCFDAMVKLAAERFIPPAYAREFGIGWHMRDEYMEREAWGLPEIVLPDGTKKTKIFIPAGIVIGTRRKIGIVNLTIRRIKDDAPKYWQIAGGAKDVPYIPQFKHNLPIFLLESALDAALLCLDCEAGRICNAVALGGTCKGIDPDTMAFINAAPLIIASPDLDEAGNKAGDRWQQLFPSAWIYRAAKAKDLGEMHKLAVSGNKKMPTAGEWADHAINYCRQKRA